MHRGLVWGEKNRGKIAGGKTEREWRSEGVGKDKEEK